MKRCMSEKRGKWEFRHIYKLKLLAKRRSRQVLGVRLTAPRSEGWRHMPQGLQRNCGGSEVCQAPGDVLVDAHIVRGLFPVL